MTPTGVAPRILLINWRDVRNPEAGGAEIYYHEIFRRVAAGGIGVDVLAHAFAGAPAEEIIDGVRVIRRGSRALFNYDIIPFVKRHGSEYGLVIEDLNKIPFFTPLYYRGPRLHLVMHFFGSSIFHETAFPFAMYVWLMERLVGPSYRNERFVAISRSTADDIRRKVGRVASIDVVEPGIDTSYYHATVPKSSTPLIACVTRLKKYKNVQFLIDAMPRLREMVPGVELAIAGGGEYMEPLKHRARALGVEQCVRFMGRIPEEQKRELLSRATVFVNPSAKEGWGITTIEAAMCGTATVASDVAGLRDSVHDGQTGLLFRYGDSGDYIEKVAAVLGDPVRRAGMEKAAGAFGQTLSWDAMADRMLRVLQRELAGRAGGEAHG